MPILSRLLLGLYPTSYRRRFGEEWRDVAAWQWETARANRFRRLRASSRLVGDTLRALPRAYASALWDAVAGWRRRSGRSGTRTAPTSGAGGWGGGGRQGPFDIVIQDLRYALRGLVRNRVFALAAIVSLALGIGANTAIFSVVNAVLMRPLPYADSQRLAIVWNEFTAAGLVRLPVSGPELDALRARREAFVDVGGIWATSRTVLADDEPVTLATGLITSNFFSVLGVQPLLGRSFAEEEAGVPLAQRAIISDEFWRANFGADPEVIGRTLQFGASAGVIVGVMPPGFTLHFPPDGGIPKRLDLFLPLPWRLNALPPDQHFLRVVARLQPDVTIPMAQQHVTEVADQMRATYAPLAAEGDHFTAVPLQADAVRAARPVLLALLGGVALFLLLAAANVASLLLARTTTRGREMAIRESLGASRGRIAALLLTESVVLTGLGTLAGFWLGQVAVDALWAARPEGIARVDAIELDGRVLLFTAGAAVIAGLVCGLAPLMQLTGFRPMTSLRIGSLVSSKRSRRWRKLVIAGGVAVSLVLLIGAGLMARTFTRLQQADIGFQPARLLTLKVALPQQRFPSDAERARIARDLESRLAEIPGVVAAGAGSHLPLADWANWGDPAPPETAPQSERPSYFADHRSVTTGYLDAIGARVVAGRGFTPSDDADHEPVVIVDRAHAARAYPGEEVVGKRIYASRYVNGDFSPTLATIVGVIDDIRDRSPGEPSAGQVYWPFAQSARWELTYVLRAAGDPVALAPAARAAVQSLRLGLAATEVRGMDDYMVEATAHPRFVLLLSTVFSALALLLSGLGVFSVISFSTAQRAREMGLRVALGARSSSILRLVLSEGAQLGALGIALGVPAAVALTRFLDSVLYGVSATDPLTFAAAAMLFFGLIVAAALGPAYRATKADPLRTMQSE